MREIVQYCEESQIPFRTLPGLRGIADGTVTVNALREVLLEDLLGREEVYLDWQAIKSSILNKVILVTGGGGSIGSEQCGHRAMRGLTRLFPRPSRMNPLLCGRERRHVFQAGPCGIARGPVRNC